MSIYFQLNSLNFRCLPFSSSLSSGGRANHRSNREHEWIRLSQMQGIYIYICMNVHMSLRIYICMFVCIYSFVNMLRFSYVISLFFLERIENFPANNRWSARNGGRDECAFPGQSSFGSSYWYMSSLCLILSLLSHSLTLSLSLSLSFSLCLLCLLSLLFLSSLFFSFCLLPVSPLNILSCRALL